ncbi:MAG TPA: hypothetical protein DCR20_12235 [Planctomycetaceae bacterium]|jgi:hypothetical protein|nr:hypothetical protein [Planctomycetaceae bacterium]
MTASAAAARLQAIQQLRGQLRAASAPVAARNVCPTGLTTLDQLLPDGGIPSGSVVEWLSRGPGQSATSLALRAASGLLTRPGCLAVIDEARGFFPALAPLHGIPLSRILLIQPPPDTRSQSGQSLWALEQTARSRGVQVVLAWINRCTSAVVRRLQLAVEHSGATVMLIRPAIALQQPSFADLRLLVEPHTPCHNQRLLKVSLLRSRQGLLHEGSIQLLQESSERFVSVETPRLN